MVRNLVLIHSNVVVSTFQKHVIGCHRFALLVGHAGDLQTASDRLGHASSATTKKYYRSNITKVVPLSSYMKVGIPHYYWCVTAHNSDCNRRVGIQETA